MLKSSSLNEDEVGADAAGSDVPIFSRDSVDAEADSDKCSKLLIGSRSSSSMNDHSNMSDKH